MNFKAVLAVIALFTTGFFAFHAYNGTLPQLTTTISNAINPTLNQILVAWNSIPEVARGIILLGIPTAFAIFFAWTKTRAMNKLTQQQQLATQQITQLQGKKAETEAEARLYAQQAESYKTQLGQQSNAGFEELLKSRDEAQFLVTAKQKEITDLNAQVKALQATIEQMKLKTYEVTVVK